MHNISRGSLSLSGASRCLAIFTLAALLLAPGLARAGTVVVFDVEDQTRRLKKNELRTLVELLAGKLAERRALQVVPREVLAAELAKKRRWRCFDWSCQSRVARGLKARYVLATRVIRLGQGCMVMGSLYNLQTSLLQQATSIKSGCKLEQLAAVMDRLPVRLTRRLRMDKSRPRSRTGAKPRPEGSSAANFDEPGMGTGHKVTRPRLGPKPQVAEPVEEPAPPPRSMPLWPALVAAGAGVVGLSLGIPFIALDGTGHNCEGPEQDNYAHCADLWDTGAAGWIFTGLGLGALATAGVLYYFHRASRAAGGGREASLPALMMTPSADGGFVVGAAGRF